jgi:hypothetical protein
VSKGSIKAKLPKRTKRVRRKLIKGKRLNRTLYPNTASQRSGFEFVNAPLWQEQEQEQEQENEEIQLKLPGMEDEEPEAKPFKTGSPIPTIIDTLFKTPTYGFLFGLAIGGLVRNYKPSKSPKKKEEKNEAIETFGPPPKFKGKGIR